ncbi:MAG TPA: hypothetical protein VEU30_06675, partial [Thermoanaerobaculia bacterium]|nr:hypothetical protein [Thermoanaerobaculia bacterium]
MRIVSALVLSLAALGAFAQPLRFGEFAPLANIRYGEERGSQLTTNGTDVFLLGTRLTPVVAGERRVGHAVFDDSPVAYASDIVWTGTHFLAVGTALNPSVIVGRIVDRNGQPQGETFEIVRGGTSPRIAWNGRNVLMLYSTSGYAAESRLRAVTLDASGKPHQNDAELGPGAWRYAVASNGAGFAAVAADATPYDNDEPSTVRFTTFDDAGTVRSTTHRDGIPVREVALASNGHEYLALWVASRRQLFAATLAPGAATSEPFLVDDGGAESGAPSAVWDGTRYRIAWRAGAEQEVRLLSLDGTTAVIDSETPTSTYSGAALLIAGNRTLLLWETPERETRVRDTSNPADGGAAVAFGAVEQWGVVTASTPAATLVVWKEYAEGRYRLHGGVRTKDGGWSERMLVDDVSEGGFPIAATNGEEFLVFDSLDNHRQFALRVSTAGRAIGDPVLVATTAPVASVVWVGDAWAVAGSRWQLWDRT